MIQKPLDRIERIYLLEVARGLALTARHFFDVGIRILHGDDVDAMSRAYRFAHHARHATGSAILSFGQAMPRP